MILLNQCSLCSKYVYAVLLLLNGITKIQLSSFKILIYESHSTVDILFKMGMGNVHRNDLKGEFTYSTRVYQFYHYFCKKIPFLYICPGCSWGIRLKKRKWKEKQTRWFWINIACNYLILRLNISWISRCTW